MVDPFCLLLCRRIVSVIHSAIASKRLTSAFLQHARVAATVSRLCGIVYPIVINHGNRRNVLNHPGFGEAGKR